MKSNNFENNSHLTDYYANQNPEIPQSHDNDYAYKAVVKCVYKCNECSEVFLTKNQLNYYICKNHYNYFALTYHITVVSIDYVTVMTSLKTINKNSQSICLNSEALHTLVNHSLTDEDQINNTSWFVKINKINSNFISNEYVNLCIYIHNNDTDKIFINIKAYVINELNIELLININVMQKKDMMLNCEKDILTLTNHHEFTALFVRTVKQQDIVYYCQF